MICIKVNVLGVEYTIEEKDKDFNETFEHYDAYCDTSVKKIYICKFEEDDTNKENLEYVKNKIIRHELIHAFIYESGLDVEEYWALNETMVDYFAIQIPKIVQVFEELNII